jgi:hypothetical protein
MEEYQLFSVEMELVFFFVKKSVLTRSGYLKYILKLKIALNENTRNIMVQNWRFIAALLSLPILSLSAGESSNASHLQEIAHGEATYTSQSEKRSTPRRNQAEKSVPEEEAMRSQPVITPQVAPLVVDGVNAFVTADFIYWRTNIDGMEYAYGGVGGMIADAPVLIPIPIATLGTNTARGSAHNPEFKFEPGVKVGLGWHMDHDGWDLVANWTFLASGNRTNSVSAIDTGTGLIAAQPVFLSETSSPSIFYLSHASSHWKQNFNIIDLELGRDFFLSRYLTMRPHIGLKSAWIQETTTNILIPTYESSGDDLNAITSVSLYNSQHMAGLGIRGGFDTGWHITKNWMFYGDLALTNLWGRVKKVAVGTNTETPAGKITTLNSIQSYYTVIPVIEAGIGLSHIAWFCKNRYRFEARVGWEEQVWLGFNRSQDYTRVGNLSVHGLTIKTMFNF